MDYRNYFLELFRVPVNTRNKSLTTLREDTPIEAVVENFLATKRSLATRQAYRIDLLQFLSQLPMKERSLHAILSVPFSAMCDEVQAFLVLVQKVNSHTGQVANPSSTNRKKYALSSFFNYLIDTYGYPKNPTKSVVALPVHKRSKTQTLTRKELLALFEVLRSSSTKGEGAFRDYLMVLALFYLALRRKEVAHLRWRQVDFENKTIRLIQKGGREKILPVPTGFLILLKTFKSTYGQPCEYIFHPVKNNRGKDVTKPISSDYIFKLVRRVAAKTVPNKKVTPHSFRASFVTLALKEGEDLISVMNATGHSSVEMVKYYDGRDALESNAINRLGEWI